MPLRLLLTRARRSPRARAARDGRPASAMAGWLCLLGARRARLVVAALMVACTLSGSDSDNRDHKCMVNTSSDWDTWGLQLHHDDPRYCPVIIPDHYNDYVYMAGSAVDPQNHHVPGDPTVVSVINTDGWYATEGDDPYNPGPYHFPFLWDGTYWQAQYNFYYRAGTGAGSIGSDDGKVQVNVQYSQSGGTLVAHVNLTVCVEAVQTCRST